MKAGRRISLALALSLILFLPVAYADNTITLTSPNAQLNGNFGFSVAVNEGDPIVVVGAPFESAGTPAQTEAGNAYVLDTTIGLITTLTSPTPQFRGDFGLSVAVSGTTVVVGAPFEIVGLLTDAGHAYSFDASTGFLTTTLTSPNAQLNGRFGFSVAVTEIDPIVVVGAPRESGGGSPQAGHAYIFS